MKRKKGQIDFPIIGFAVVVVGLIILAPIMLKIFISIKEPVSIALGNVSVGGDVAQANFNAVMTPVVNMWDKIIMFAFFTAVLLLIISSLFIDTHPAFVVLYIFIGFMTVLFIPSIIQAADNIYESSQFLEETTYLTFVDALRTNFMLIILGLMVLTGIIIYAKISLFPNQGGIR